MFGAVVATLPCLAFLGPLASVRSPASSVDLGMPKPSKPPENLKPWLGVWIETRIDDEAYNRALEASGIPWPIRELLAKFTAQREFALPPGKPLLIRSKMITGACSGHANS